MPHDTKGRLIEVGDVVAARVYADGGYVTRAAVVSKVTPGATTCNVEAVYPTTLTGTFTASEVELLTKADGAQPA